MPNTEAATQAREAAEILDAKAPEAQEKVAAMGGEDQPDRDG